MKLGYGVQGQKRQVKVLEAGGFFGEVALINHAPRAADCVAFSKLKVRLHRLASMRAPKAPGAVADHFSCQGTSLLVPRAGCVQRLDYCTAPEVLLCRATGSYAFALINDRGHSYWSVTP